MSSLAITALRASVRLLPCYFPSHSPYNLGINGFLVTSRLLCDVDRPAHRQNCYTRQDLPPILLQRVGGFDGRTQTTTRSIRRCCLGQLCFLPAAAKLF